MPLAAALASTRSYHRQSEDSVTTKVTASPKQNRFTSANSGRVHKNNKAKKAKNASSVANKHRAIGPSFGGARTAAVLCISQGEEVGERFKYRMCWHACVANVQTYNEITQIRVASPSTELETGVEDLLRNYERTRDVNATSNDCARDDNGPKHKNAQVTAGSG